MTDPIPAAAPAQFRNLLRDFALDPGPLTDELLTAEHLARVITAEAGKSCLTGDPGIFRQHFIPNDTSPHLRPSFPLVQRKGWFR